MAPTSSAQDIQAGITPTEQQLQQSQKQIQAQEQQIKLHEQQLSQVGSAALNQKLSTERAENVTTFLEQQGQIPLTNILAPGAMGASKQVAPDITAEGRLRTAGSSSGSCKIKGIAGT